jgi:integrase/recombinase XerD
MKSNMQVLEKVGSFTSDKIIDDKLTDNLRQSLSRCMQLYFELHVTGSPEGTIRAKTNDLKKFLEFYQKVLGSDLVDLWTPAVTKGFQKELSKSLKATSINRAFASLRHFSSWLHKLRPLPAGNPFQGIQDIVVDDPDWNGLTDRQILLLKSACQIRINACKKKNQNPLLETAVFFSLMSTGLRETELINLKVGQYHSKGFHNVKRKGKKVTRKISVPEETREYLDKYLMQRIHKAGLSSGLSMIQNLPTDDYIFRNPKGKKISERAIRMILERLSRQACAQLPEKERFHAAPHMLRHSFLKRVADKHGVHTAQELSGNVSMREVWRYTRPSDQEKEEISEEIFK